MPAPPPAWGSGPGQTTDEDRAELVLLDIAEGRSVGEVREDQSEVLRHQVELVGQPPSHGLLHLLPGAGWPQHVLDHTPGNVAFSAARCVTSSRPVPSNP